MPDLAAAQRFLNLLEPDGVFQFQTFEEPKNGGRVAPCKPRGKFIEVQDELVRLNLSGSGVCVQVNAGETRLDSDVTRIRAYFVDQDTGSSELLLGSPAPADIIVESSPGKHHGYWLTSSARVDQFAVRQKALAARFNSDQTVCNPARVMRLPGFIHRKGDPFITRILRTMKDARHE